MAGFNAEFPKFPDEIWDKILENLTDLDDLRNASASHPIWKRILYPKRTLWMFSEVLPILENYRIRCPDRRSCRLVCRNWSQAVNKSVQNHFKLAEAERIHNLDYEERYWFLPDPFPNRFTIYLERDNFGPRSQAEMALHPRNPFVGSAVWLKYQFYVSDELATSYSTLISRVDIFPALCGQHIKHLDLTCDSVERPYVLATASYLTTVVCAVIKNMPNLENLWIKGRLEYISERRNLDNEEREQVESQIVNDISLHHLKNLQVFQLEYSCRKNSFNELMENLLAQKYISQLKIFRIKWNEALWRDLDWTNLPSQSVPCNKFSDLPFYAPSLQRLDARISYKIRNEMAPLVTILKCCPNLVTLSLDYCGYRESECENIWPALQLPNILKGNTFPLLINLTVNRKPLLKELLELFPNLQYLRIYHSYLDCNYDRKERSWKGCCGYDLFMKYDIFGIGGTFAFDFTCDGYYNNDERKTIEHEWNWWKINLVPVIDPEVEVEGYENPLKCEENCNNFECREDIRPSWRGLQEWGAENEGNEGKEEKDTEEEDYFQPWELPSLPALNDWRDELTVRELLGMFSLPSLEKICVNQIHCHYNVKLSNKNFQKSAWQENINPNKYKYSFVDTTYNYKCRWGYSIRIQGNGPPRFRKWCWWDWKKFDYGYSLQMLQEIPFRHELHLEADSPNFVTADYWMTRVCIMQELFPTVKTITFSHCPIPRDFLKCFPNVETIKIPSVFGVGHVYCERWNDPITYDFYDPESDILQKETIYGIKSFYDSEIWDLLPCLQKIEVLRITHQHQDDTVEGVCTRVKLQKRLEKKARNSSTNVYWPPKLHV